MAPFVLFCTPRTGSYHFVSLLASAPDIDCHGEIFKPERVELAAPVLAALGITPKDFEQRDAQPLRFVERVRALTPAGRMFGFKLFLNHLGTRKALRDGLLWAPGWRKIVLDRHPVESYASLLRAQRTGVWTLPPGREVAPEVLQQPVRFEAESFEQHLRLHGKFRRHVEQMREQAGNPVLELDYTRLVQGDGLAEALRFLGSTADPAALQTSMRKQYEGELRAGFANWPEFEAWLNAHGLTPPA